MAFALLGVFPRFDSRPTAGWADAIWTSLSANSFGTFVLHYPAVTWAQYGLLDAPLDAPARRPWSFPPRSP